MTRYRLPPTALCVLTCGLLVGCMPKMTIEEMKAAMPDRPPELNKLDAFVGKWKWEGEADFAGLDRAIKTSGSEEMKWDGDRWFLVNRGVFNMEEFGDMHGLGTWTYDSHSKKFRSTWVDSMGSLGTGVLWTDATGKIWHVRATNHSPFGKTTARGRVTFVDDNTMEWTWTEYMMGGLMKTMEMTGTSRRQ